MTDRDQAQVNSIWAVIPECHPLHVLSESASEVDEHKSPDQPVGDSTAHDNSIAFILSAANESISLLQHLITEAPKDPKFAKSLQII